MGPSNTIQIPPFFTPMIMGERVPRKLPPDVTCFSIRL